eukprot:TRINITY_DN16887_c0_g1_i1.p1 TRINITY_DN16887_c0_g1~~TRINITY_DN16887_c0_g1_i1.p1  ORF type:complete len:103 (+),score=14.04 TRINITY_DN16887_c0_g1_i1:63-371(+)
MCIRDRAYSQLVALTSAKRLSESLVSDNTSQVGNTSKMLRLKERSNPSAYEKENLTKNFARIPAKEVALTSKSRELSTANNCVNNCHFIFARYQAARYLQIL